MMALRFFVAISVKTGSRFCLRVGDITGTDEASCVASHRRDRFVVVKSSPPPPHLPTPTV